MFDCVFPVKAKKEFLAKVTVWDFSLKKFSNNA